MIEFFERIGLVEQLENRQFYQPKSPNHYDPGQILIGFILSVIAGAQRFAHTNQLRADRALQALLGMERFPSDDTILNYFRRFSQAEIQRFWRPLWCWLISRLPKLEKGFSLDLDSTIFSRHGAQERQKVGGQTAFRSGSCVCRCDLNFGYGEHLSTIPIPAAQPSTCSGSAICSGSGLRRACAICPIAGSTSLTAALTTVPPIA